MSRIWNLDTLDGRAWPSATTEREPGPGYRGGEWTVDQFASQFKGAQREAVGQRLESLAALGLAVRFEGDVEARWHGVERGGLG